MLRRLGLAALALATGCKLPTDRFEPTSDGGAAQGSGYDGNLDAGAARRCPTIAFAPARSIFRGAASAIAVGNIDTDSPDDIAVVSPGAGSAAGTLTLLHNTHGGTFSASGGLDGIGSDPRAVAIADLNHDGNRDIAVANYDDSTRTVQVFLSSPSSVGGFRASTSYPTRGNPSAIAVGDLFPTTGVDLAVTDENAGGFISVLVNNGSGGFGGVMPRQDIATEPEGTPRAIAAGNFDGGPLDLAVANHKTSTLNVLLGQGNGSYQLLPSVTLPETQPTSIAVADVDRDQRSDRLP